MLELLDNRVLWKNLVLYKTLQQRTLFSTRTPSLLLPRGGNLHASSSDHDLLRLEAPDSTLDYKHIYTAMARLEQDPYTQDGLWNVVVIGDKRVGKSRLVKSLAQSARLATSTLHRPSDDDPVIDAVSGIYRLGIDYVTRRVALDSLIIKLQVWDGNALGNGHYTSVPFKYANVVLIVFDVTQKSTFESIPKILKTTREKLQAQNSGNAAILLLANLTSDSSARVVSYETAKRFANERGMVYLEGNVNDITSVDEVVCRMASECINLSYLGDVTFNASRQRRLTQPGGHGRGRGPERCLIM